jgi:CRISPR-associated protein Cmr5
MSFNLEQERAALAFRHVTELQGEKERQRYGSLALKLPALLRTSGLCQSVHFLRSRTTNPASSQLLTHLAIQLRRVDPSIQTDDDLCARARRCELALYLWLAREAVASANWYARLAQSELGVLPGTESGEGR